MKPLDKSTRKTHTVQINTFGFCLIRFTVWHNKWTQIKIKFIWILKFGGKVHTLQFNKFAISIYTEREREIHLRWPLFAITIAQDFFNKFLNFSNNSPNFFYFETGWRVSFSRLPHKSNDIYFKYFIDVIHWIKILWLAYNLTIYKFHLQSNTQHIWSFTVISIQFFACLLFSFLFISFLGYYYYYYFSYGSITITDTWKRRAYKYTHSRHS